MSESDIHALSDQLEVFLRGTNTIKSSHSGHICSTHCMRQFQAVIYEQTNNGTKEKHYCFPTLCSIHPWWATNQVVNTPVDIIYCCPKTYTVHLCGVLCDKVSTIGAICPISGIIPHSSMHSSYDTSIQESLIDRQEIHRERIMPHTHMEVRILRSTRKENKGFPTMILQILHTLFFSTERAQLNHNQNVPILKAGVKMVEDHYKKAIQLKKPLLLFDLVYKWRKLFWSKRTTTLTDVPLPDKDMQFILWTIMRQVLWYHQILQMHVEIPSLLYQPELIITLLYIMRDGIRQNMGVVMPPNHWLFHTLPSPNMLNLFTLKYRYSIVAIKKKIQPALIKLLEDKLFPTWFFVPPNNLIPFYDAKCTTSCISSRKDYQYVWGQHLFGTYEKMSNLIDALLHRDGTNANIDALYYRLLYLLLLWHKFPSPPNPYIFLHYLWLWPSLESTEFISPFSGKPEPLCPPYTFPEALSLDSFTLRDQLYLFQVTAPNLFHSTQKDSFSNEICYYHCDTNFQWCEWISPPMLFTWCIYRLLSVAHEEVYFTHQLYELTIKVLQEFRLHITCKEFSASLTSAHYGPYPDTDPGLWFIHSWKDVYTFFTTKIQPCHSDLSDT